LKTRIFITGYYGFGNTGDEAILMAMIEHLRELRPDLKITATSATPEKTAAAYNIESILWSDTLAMLEAVRASDLVVIGGGGIFHDYWGFNPNAFLTDHHWGISFYTAPAVLGALYNKPVMLYAVGIGPLLSEHGKKFTKAACGAATVITVRDEPSKQLLESIGVDPARVTVTADPAFGFNTTRQDVELPPISAKPLIGVALRNWDVGIHPSFWEQEAAAGLDLFLADNPGHVLFVPFQRLEGQPEDDLSVAIRVRSNMKHHERATVLSAALSPQQLFTVLSQCDLVVGMRLHSLILAVLGNVPVLALSYDSKVEQAMQRTGLEAFTIDIRAIDSTRMADLMKDALSAEKKPVFLGDAARQNARMALEALDSGASATVTPETLSLLTRGIQAQLRESHMLRAETKRLFKETEHYQGEHSATLAKLNELSLQTAQLEAEQNSILVNIEKEVENRQIRETQALLTRAEELSSDLAKIETEFVSLTATTAALREETEALKTLLNTSQEKFNTSQERLNASQEKLNTSEEKLRKADETREKVIKALDKFHWSFENILTGYRNQRAWQIMLLIRKAYTLLHHQGFAKFLQWTLSIPFSGFGDLAEYDLKFPQAWNYMPERLEEAFSPEPRAVEERSAEPAVPQKLSELLPQKKYDILIFAIFDFEFRFQRPQQIAAQFARLGHRVFWISPARWMPPTSEQRYEAIALRENLWEIHLRGQRPELYTGHMTAEEAQSITGCVQKLYEDFHIAESCAILQFPYWRKAGLGLREQFGAKILYDCMDDWQNWTAEPRISEENLAEERRLARECDVLVVTSQEFLERQQAAGLKPILARNGADFDFFASPRSNDLLVGVPKPIVGYYGAIADWFDLELVTKLAQSRPQYSFVLIGQVHGVDVSKLESLPNVRLLGEKNYREIPLYLSHFNVCLIPFRLNKLTKGVDPVKMYEYFSQGKSVVATDMAELAQSTDLLYIGKNLVDFASKVDHAIQERDPQLQKRRIAYAAANTWGARVETMDAAIEASFPKVSILMVTYNCEEFIEPCLDSIARSTAWPNYEIILIDNNSTDGTKAIIQEYAEADKRILLSCLPENLGFAGANNVAAREAKGAYLVFLNPDTVVTSGWLGRMVRHCERDASIGSVAAVTNFSGNETKVNFDYGNVLEMEKFALALAHDKAGQATDIAVAPLYCVLVPRAVWEKVGELDAGFQIGMFEDDDFSLRIKTAGYRVVAADDCFIHHFGNGSFAKLPSKESLRIFEQNKKRYEQKWNAPWKPHQLRAGVRAPYEDIRLSPSEFLTVNGAAAKRPAKVGLTIKKLHPAGTTAQQAFNLQPGIGSALVVECENATPGTVIMMGTTMLTTSYGSQIMLSGLVPAGLYASAGVQPVYLLNDFGESARVDFVVEPNS
jgi:polysaccharide pyruvyl transferase CsaB